MNELNFQPYPEYKASGVPWLGDIPSHWEVKKITRLVDEIGSGTTPKSDDFSLYENGDILWVTTSELRENFIADTKKKVTLDAMQTYSALKLFPPNSVAIAMYGATIGRLGILSKPATFNQACCVYSKSKKIYFNFLYYWLWYRRPILISLSNGGGQPNLNQDDLRQLRVAIPDYTEQQTIAAYLDKKLSHIDALISKQQQLLEKLAEQRTAVISHAVTKGLNPDAPMKDSGVAWLGDIPSHWEATNIRFVTSKVGSGKTPKGGAETYKESGIALLRSQNIHFSHISLNDAVYISQETHDSMENSKVYKGDVLLNITGGSLGRCSYVENELDMNVNQHVCIVRPKEIILTKFLHFFLCSNFGQEQIWFYQQGGGREGLNFQDLKCFDIFLPPLNTQQEIVNYLDQQTAKIDKMTTATHAIIDKLNEYRSALITQAVTGKIDIREQS